MTLSLTLEIITALFVILSGLSTLVGAMGILWMPSFFDRQHPPALAYSAGAWCAGFAAVAHFARVDGYSGLKAIFVAILLALAVPVSNMMLARAGLFRQRWQARQDPGPATAPPAGNRPALPEILQPGGAPANGRPEAPRETG